MPTFIVSLFLPWTIDLGSENHTEGAMHPALDSHLEPQHDSIRSGDDSDISPIPPTPGATTDAEKVFVARDVAQSLPLRLPRSQSTISLRSYIRPEPNEAMRNVKNDLIDHTASDGIPPFVSDYNQFRSPDYSVDNDTGSSYERETNHLDYSVIATDRGNNALISAVEAANTQERSNDKKWVGTLGLQTDSLPEQARRNIANQLEQQNACIPVFVSDKDFACHYEQYCKLILWPHLNYQVPDGVNSKAFMDSNWAFYVRVNQAFADCIVQNWESGDIIWINDYHLSLVPGMVRTHLPNAQIGFFLHTAFPPSDIFRSLAKREEILDGLLGANLVGFQTYEHLRHFSQTSSELLNVEANMQQIILEDGRTIHIGVFPMGIDPTSISICIQHPDVRYWFDVFKEKHVGKRMIIGRDKPDLIGGIYKKLLAFDSFLTLWPEYKDQVVLIQIATLTPEDPDLSSRIDLLIQKINSNHGSITHIPLVYLKKDIPYAQWLALIMVSDALLVTSHREGMNLMGHEYVFCSDYIPGDRKCSPVIISEFTGSATLLEQGALLVNPWDSKECATKIKMALEMLPQEKERRWKLMWGAIMEHDAFKWFTTFRKSLEIAWNDQTSRDVNSVPYVPVMDVVKRYNQAKARLLILDYEGTLVVWGSPVDTILTSFKRSIDIVNDLVEDSRNFVYVMSSKTPSELEMIFKQVSGIGLIAENGAYLLEADGQEWTPLVRDDHIAEWKANIRPTLDHFAERIEKSNIQELNSALVLSYAASPDKQAAIKMIGEYAGIINETYGSQKVGALPIKDALFIASTEVTKATATELIVDKLLYHATVLPEFLLVIGDSREDEHVFEWAHKMGEDGLVEGLEDIITVNVGARNTAASYTLKQGVTGVLKFLCMLTAPAGTSRGKQDFHVRERRSSV